ncbi:hypothetical protein CCAND95_820007 [Capnocytophaga canis]|nr:hypothetical protein CCAND95_820007 [Capnocytophaga canis]
MLNFVFSSSYIFMLQIYIIFLCNKIYYKKNKPPTVKAKGLKVLLFAVY